MNESLEMNVGPVEFWAIIELFGHARIAGKVSEAEIGGCSFIRVDVPSVEGQVAFTRYFGNGAIYSITPCSEELVRLAARQIQSSPVTIYIPEIKALPSFHDDDRDSPWDSELFFNHQSSIINHQS